MEGLGMVCVGRDKREGRRASSCFSVCFSGQHNVALRNRRTRGSGNWTLAKINLRSENDVK